MIKDAMVKAVLIEETLQNPASTNFAIKTSWLQTRVYSVQALCLTMERVKLR